MNYWRTTVFFVLLVMLTTVFGLGLLNFFHGSIASDSAQKNAASYFNALENRIHSY